MKNLLYKIYFIFLLLLITGIIIEVLIRMIPNEYIYKKQYLDNESERIEILFLGASDAECGFNPTYTLRRSFNASHPAQTIDYSYEIIKKYENEWSELKYIVLAVSYPSLFFQLGQASFEGFRIKDYTLYYKIRIYKKLKYYAEIFNGRILSQMARLFRYYIRKQDEIHCSDKGWYVTYYSPPRDSLIKSGMNRAKILTIPQNEQRFDEMKSSLDSIIYFSKRNKFKVILCTPPVHESYSDNFNKYQYYKTINTYNEIARENKNCTYINLLKDSRFKDEDFLDGDHLNGNGAKKLTLIIDSIVNKEY